MLKELTLNSTVYLVTGYSDLRKGIEGLAAVIQGTLSLDPFNKSLYLFCGRRRDRIKGLLWEGDGFLLMYKRLDSGVFRGHGMKRRQDCYPNRKSVGFWRAWSLNNPRQLRNPNRGFCIKKRRMKYGYLQAVTEMFAGNLQTFPFFYDIIFL